MAKLKMGGKRCPGVRSLTLFLLLLLFAAFGQAQAGQPEEKQKAAGESPATTQSTTQPTTQPAEEQKISPQEAEKLFRSVDEILQFASKDTLLPIKHEVKRQLVSRDEVEAYVSKHTSEDEDAKRLRRSELVLKKFGLLPRDFDLGKFLVAAAERAGRGILRSQNQDRESSRLAGRGPAKAGAGARTDPCAAGPVFQSFEGARWLPRT